MNQFTMSFSATDPRGHSAKMINAITENLFEKKIDNVDSSNCNHDFEFIELLGTFCKVFKLHFEETQFI